MNLADRFDSTVVATAYNLTESLGRDRVLTDKVLTWEEVVFTKSSDSYKDFSFSLFFVLIGEFGKGLAVDFVS